MRPTSCPAGSVIERNRRLVLERFPYSIIFTYDDAEVRIVAFAHGGESPGIGASSERNAGSATGLLQRARLASSCIEHAPGKQRRPRNLVPPAGQHIDPSRTPAASTTAAANAVAKSLHDAPSALALRKSSASERSASLPVHAWSTRDPVGSREALELCGADFET
jgi:hypothetical protein